MFGREEYEEIPMIYWSCYDIDEACYRIDKIEAHIKEHEDLIIALEEA